MKFLRTTILGGLLFLLPLVVTVAVLGKALGIVHTLAGPLLNALPVDTFAGIAVVHIVPVAILVLLCFAAGVLAQRPAAGRLVNALEQGVLMKFPPYALFKAKTGSALKPQERDKLTPVVVRFDDSWQLAYQIERDCAGREVIFLPGSPDPWSGSVCAVDAERVTYLDTSVKNVGNALKRLGKGTAELTNTSA